jgi:hypothetical protein
MVLKNGLDYQQLMEYPNSDVEDNGSDSFCNESTLSFSTEMEKTSEQEDSLTPDDDSDMYLMNLMSPGLKTPQLSPRVSVIYPKLESPADYTSESINSTKILLLNRPCTPLVENLGTLQEELTNVRHSPVPEE